MLTPKRAALFSILILSVAPYFMRLGASSLWDSNEAFYAETPREMIESGDWISPSFNYQPRFNKPPLCYWVVAIFYKLFGISETVERVAIALGALVMIITAYCIGRELFSVEVGLLAAIGLAIAPRFLMFSRRIMIDVYLAMFMSLALLFFILAEDRQERRRLYLALMYASIGLGVMTKGPVAAVLPAVVLLIHLAIRRNLPMLREMMLPYGALIIAAIVLPWYGMVYAQHGWQYIETFIFKDNLSRYTEPVWGPRRGPFFYIPVLLGDMFPWSFFLIPLVWAAARGRAAQGEAGQKKETGWLLPAIWITVIVAFYSLSRNKEDLYILPIYPAAAALVGALLSGQFAGRGERVAAGRWMAIALGALIAGVGAGALYVFARSSQTYRFAGAVVISGVTIAGGLFIAGAAAMRRSEAAVMASAVVMAAVNWVFVLATLPDFERFKPVRPLVEAIQSKAGEGALIGYYRVASPSMAFYLRRQVFEYYKEEELEQALGSGKEVYCLMQQADYEAMKSVSSSKLYILASRPIFQVKLRSILYEAEPPRLLLVSNKGGIEIEQ